MIIESAYTDERLNISLQGRLDTTTAPLLEKVILDIAMCTLTIKDKNQKEEPKNPQGPSPKADKIDSKKVGAKTGDSNNAVIWFMILCIAGSGICLRIKNNKIR